MKNKRIVITGASSGIGEELCRRLGEENQVVAAARRAEKIPTGANIFPVRCDVSKPDDLDHLFTEAAERLGGIDVFLANAGFAYYELLDGPDWDHIDRIFQTDVYSVVYSLQKLREIQGDRGFSFGITASAMSFMAMPGYALYSGCKFALKGVMDGMRYELRRDQKIHMVYPIATLTSFFEQAGSKDDLPWPRQTVDTVAKRIIRGVDRGRKHIFPSRLFHGMLILNNFLPIMPLYMARERKKLSQLGRTDKEKRG